MAIKFRLVYGSLRKGEYNFKGFQTTFGEDSVMKVGETTLKGWKLYSLGSYPTIVPLSEDDNQDDFPPIKLDLLALSEDAAYSIDRMESGAGYLEEVLSISIDDLTEVSDSLRDLHSHPDLHITTRLYFMEEVPYYAGPLIESGDWTRRHEQFAREAEVEQE